MGPDAQAAAVNRRDIRSCAFAAAAQALATSMRALVLAPVLLGTGAAFGSEPYHAENIMLLQPDSVLQERVGDAHALADYIKAVEGAAENTLKTTAPTPASGFIVLAVRPGGASRVWLDFSPALPLAIEKKLLSAVEAVPPFSAKNGVVVFAINSSLWGAPPTKQRAPRVPEWQKAVESAGHPLEAGDLIDRVWPSEPSSNTTDFPVTEGFQLQVLEPTGGKIARPSDWFYRERHNGSSYTWIISKEDPDKGPYETGVRIQTLVGIKAGTEKSPEQFVRNFITQKKATATVLSECEAHDQGLFTRVCLETTEAANIAGPPTLWHIQYSAFWGNGSDIVIIMTAGTTSAFWPQYEKYFATMGQFELIDMSRFAKRPD